MIGKEKKVLENLKTQVKFKQICAEDYMIYIFWNRVFLKAISAGRDMCRLSVEVLSRMVRK